MEKTPRRSRLTPSDFFLRCDDNGDGVLTADELYGGLAFLGVRMDVSLLESIFAQLDADGDGRVSHSEWCAMLGVGDEELRTECERSLSLLKPPAPPPVARGASGEKRGPAGSTIDAFLARAKRTHHEPE